MYSSELRIYRILQILPDLRENFNVVAAPPKPAPFEIPEVSAPASEGQLARSNSLATHIFLRFDP